MGFVSQFIPTRLLPLITETACLKRRKAVRQATRSRRLDICSAQMARLFHLADQPSIEGKTCLEIGSC
jgi:hypothetical protein